VVSVPLSAIIGTLNRPVAFGLTATGGVLIQGALNSAVPLSLSASSGNARSRVTRLQIGVRLGL